MSTLEEVIHNAENGEEIYIPCKSYRSFVALRAKAYRVRKQCGSTIVLGKYVSEDTEEIFLHFCTKRDREGLKTFTKEEIERRNVL